MRLLCFADLHCRLDTAAALVRRAADVDVVVAAGDFARVRSGLEETLDALAGIQCPAVLVPGNNESLDELRAAAAAWPAARVLHGEAIEIDGVPFFGIGGGIPVTPFGDWSYDLTEEAAEALLAGCPPGAVLISHSPPHQALDFDHGRHLGSTAVRAAIERARPRLTVCGHIHATAGEEADVAGCRVINPGHDGVVIEV